MNEEVLKRHFHRSDILEDLGYREENIHVESTVKHGKRTDIHCAYIPETNITNWAMLKEAK